MRKAMTAVVALTAVMLTVGCQEKLEDRAERECREQTEKNCPTPVENFASMDSMTFERGSHTISYCYTVSGAIDNAAAINGEQVRAALLQEVRNSPQLKAYKDVGYGLRYVYYSNKEKGTQLFEATFREKDYR